MSSLGFEVCEAANGQEAIEQEMAASPDLVVMDLVMPVMGGLDAIHCIRPRSPGSWGARAAAVHRRLRRSPARKTRRRASPPVPTPSSPSRSTRRVLLRIIGVQLRAHLGLCQTGREASRDGGAAEFVAPPREEMEVLACPGPGGQHARHPKAGGLPDYPGRAPSPLADRLDRLAQDYLFQALLNLVEERLQGVEPTGDGGAGGCRGAWRRSATMSRASAPGAAHPHCPDRG